MGKNSSDRVRRFKLFLFILCFWCETTSKKIKEKEEKMKILNVVHVLRPWWFFLVEWGFWRGIIIILSVGLIVFLVMKILEFRCFLRKGLGEELTEALREEGYE